MINTDEKKILALIKTLPIFIIIFSILATYIIITNNNIQFENDMKKLRSDSLNSKKLLIKSEVHRVYSFLKNEEQNTINILKENIQTQVTNAHKIAMSIYLNNKEKSKSEIKKLIKDALREIRFNNERGYLFVYEFNGKNILHPIKPKLENKSLWNYQDKKGTYLLREIKDLLKEEKEVFYSWYWSKPKNPNVEYEKLGFLKKFEPFDWFIGSGEYITDVKDDIQKKVLKTIDNIRYGKNGYIFILNKEGVLLSHINKKLVYKAPLKESLHIVEILINPLNNGKYVEYEFNDPFSSKKQRKISYVEKFSEWDWTIGTGTYSSDIDEVILNKRRKLEEKNNDQIINLLTISFVLTTILFILSIAFSNNIKNKFIKYKRSVNNKTKELKELNKTLEIQVQSRTSSLNEKTKKVTDLLNNASQGFLSFGKDFLINSEYSNECEVLLEKDLENKDITKLLFSSKIEKIPFYRDTIIDAIKEKRPLTSNLLLSLLPNSLIINKRVIFLEYKLLSDNKIMLVLTNITDKKKLEAKIKKEQNILKMIVTIVSDNIQFFETKKDYESFCKNYESFISIDNTLKENANIIYALIHTYKGLFSQFYMKNATKKLHDAESSLYIYMRNKINADNDDLVSFLKSLSLTELIKDDLKVIKNALGDSFFEENSYIRVNEKVINKLESKILSLSFLSNINKEECQEVIHDIKKIKNKPLSDYLSFYPKLCEQLCLSLNKQIHPFKIEGNKDVFVPEYFKAFINSLIHIFRNSCDHGIEIKEIRKSLNKNEIGSINCSFKVDGNMLILNITDDGKGIDLNLLKKKILKNNLCTKEDISKLSKDEIVNFIFYSDLTTKDNLSDVSGRGIGLLAVKIELEKLNGIVSIDTSLNKGISFTFSIPLYKNLNI